jgi:3-phenylpropionate/cinnamic acid dioxygenase small subunit
VVLPDSADRERMLDTMYQYASALDTGDVESWVACFTEDARYSVRDRASHSATYEVDGRDALRAYRTSHPVIAMGAPWQHQVCNTRLSCESDSSFARAHSYWTSIVADPEPRILAFGAYHDRLQRQADGSWLLCERITENHAAARVQPPAP